MQKLSPQKLMGYWLARNWPSGTALALLMVIGAGVSWTRAAECLAVQVRNQDGNYIVPGVWGDIVYGRVHGTELSLDAYVQKKGNDRPAIVLIHGGGWTSGSRITYLSQLFEPLTQAGFNWFSIDYRLAPTDKHPAALDDARAALEFIRCNFRTFRIDPNRIALLGEDTGAHLASLLAAEKPAGVKALVCFGGIFDLRSIDRFKTAGPGSVLESLFGLESTGSRADQVLAAASPLLRIVGGMPPALLLYGTEDREVPPQQSRDYCDSLRRAGGQCELRPVEGAIHVLENWRPEQWGYKAGLVDWLSKRLDLQTANFSPYRSQLTKNIVYSRYAESSGREANLVMDAYVPKGRGPFAAVILAHGGGWEAGDKVTYLTPVLEPLAKAGFAWFSIDYRLTPKYRHPDQLEDLRRAIRYVRHHARKYKVDPTRLAILGESASGQMVAQVAAQACEGMPAAADPIDRQPCTVRAAVSFYGVYDFLSLVVDTSPRSLPVRLFGISRLDDTTRDLLRSYSPLHHVHKSMPPILLIHGTNERLWQQGVTMDKKLTTAGAEHELYVVEGAPHGMENWEGHPEWMRYKQKLVDWLRLHLR